MYATVDHLKKRLGDNFAGLYPSEDDAAEDLAAAAAEIDGRLASRYVVPVSAPASLPLLKSWNLTLAEELGYARAVGGEYSDKVKSRLEQTRKLLDQAAKGEMLLPGAVETAAGVGSAAIIDGPEPVFTRDKMQGW